MAKKKQIIIRANQLFDGTKFSNNKYVIIEGEQIVDVTSNKLKADLEGIVTPAFIDPHSHIGMFRSGEPDSEAEGNDHTHQIRPTHDPINGVYFDDQAFVDAVDFGVLYSCILPGSGNVFGGKAKVIRNYAQDRSTAEFFDLGYKMALGYNPRSVTSWKGERPNTRMGVYGMLEKCFDDILRRYEQVSVDLEQKILDVNQNKALSEQEKQQKIKLIEAHCACQFSSEDTALLDALSGERTIKVHVHKEDDLLYLLELKSKYGLKITAEHLGDVFHQHIFSICAKEGVSIVYGPLGSHNYKTELKHGYYQNAKLLLDSKAHFGLMTDHPVIHSTALRDSLKYFLIAGASHEEALSIITSRNAEVLGIDSWLGKIKQGYLASLLVWSTDPLHLSAMPQVVIGEGEVLRRPKR